MVDAYPIGQIFQAMESLLGDVSGGFGDDGLVWYNYIYELFSNING